MAEIQPGKVLYEMDGVDEAIAREAFALAAAKLPLRTTFVAPPARHVTARAHEATMETKDAARQGRPTRCNKELQDAAEGAVRPAHAEGDAAAARTPPSSRASAAASRACAHVLAQKACEQDRATQPKRRIARRDAASAAWSATRWTRRSPCWSSVGSSTRSTARSSSAREVPRARRDQRGQRGRPGRDRRDAQGLARPRRGGDPRGRRRCRLTVVVPCGTPQGSDRIAGSA